MISEVAGFQIEVLVIRITLLYKYSKQFLLTIIGIFHDLDTEFVDADMDFLGFIDNEIFVVFNIITEFVQGGDDLWLVFLNLGFDVPVSDEVLDSGLNFVPD